MVFVADDLGAWLVGAVADAGRKRLTTVVLGSDQERALRSAATSAVRSTALELRPADDEHTRHVALVISQVFNSPAPGVPENRPGTILEELRAGVARQLAVLDDASLTGTGESSAQVLGVPSVVLAGRLAAHLLREIMVRGSAGGPLFPLASQLNDDLTHLQVRRLEGVVDQRADEILDLLARLGATRAVAASAIVLDQLPPSIVGFTGRDEDLVELLEFLDPAGTKEAVVVSAVAGTAGIGKTTLAVQAGHAARQQGWFGGGVLFTDLHGYDSAPVEPTQALDAMLRALGVLAEHIPSDDAERSALFRSVLAGLTEPVLIIADNASSEAQVRPLLPGSGPHKVLITSRHTLAGLGARLMSVEVLGDGASVEVLNAEVRAARPDDERICGDDEAARRLARLCGGLPLALQITAALLKADPTLSARELADQLAVESGRLEQLSYMQGVGPSVSSVAAAFELSYRRLEEVSALVFRLLPVNPGPVISTAAAAALADLPVRIARRTLASLAQAHMVEAAPGAAGRWRMHDLLRLYARQVSAENAEGDGLERAGDRLLNYYLTRADAANQLLRGEPGNAVQDGFADRRSSLAWLDAERVNLVATVSAAADAGRDQIAMRLPLVLAEYLQLRRRLDDGLAITTVSVNTARRLGDRKGESAALVTLGNILRQLRRFQEAATVCKEAVIICRQMGDRLGEAGALNNLANAQHEMGAIDESIRTQQENLAICRAMGDQLAEGKALNNLGLGLRRVGKSDEAITAHQDAARLYRQVGDRYGEGTALNNLGIALYQVGRLKEAITAYQEDVAICHELGDRYGEATTLNNIGAVLQDEQRFEKAIAAHREAAAIYQEIGDRHGEAKAMNNLGHALCQISWFDEAITAYKGAATAFREADDRHSEGRATSDLGLVLRQTARIEEAIVNLRQAAAIFRETGDHGSEHVALRHLDAINDAQQV